MEENERREIVKQLRDIREVMFAHSEAHRGHKAAIQRLVGTFDKAQKVVAAIRKEAPAARVKSWVLKGKAINFGLQSKGLEIFK